MPGMTKTGGEWDELEKAAVARDVVSGTLSIRDACARYQLAPECIVDWLVAFRRSAIQAFDKHLRETLVSQGFDANDAAAAEFTGTLGEITIADLIQTMELGRRDGVVTVLHDGTQSRIWCAAGEIVDAESGKLNGVAALYRVLALEHGRIIADFSPVGRPRTVNLSTTALLLDGARRMDECNARKKSLGSCLYELGPKGLSAEATFADVERAIVRFFYRPTSVQRALAESELGDLETLRAISRLVENEFLLSDHESGISPTGSFPQDSLSSPPMVMSFLNPVRSRRARPSLRSRRTIVGGLAGLCVVGLACWLLPQRLVGSWEGTVDAVSVLSLAGPDTSPFAALTVGPGVHDEAWFGEVMCLREAASSQWSGARRRQRLDAFRWDGAAQAVCRAGAVPPSPPPSRDASVPFERAKPRSRTLVRGETAAAPAPAPAPAPARAAPSTPSAAVEAPATVLRMEPRIQIIEGLRPNMQLVE